MAVSGEDFYCQLLLPTATVFVVLRSTRNAENRTVLFANCTAAEERISLEQREDAEIV